MLKGVLKIHFSWFFLQIFTDFHIKFKGLKHP